MRGTYDYLENYLNAFHSGISTRFRIKVFGETLKENDSDIENGLWALDRLDIMTRDLLGQSIQKYKE